MVYADWSLAAMLTNVAAPDSTARLSLTQDTVTVSKVQDASAIARNHLANERTYLSWVRTVMAFVGFGLVFARLSGGIPSLAIGVAFIVSGLVILIQALYRYQILKGALMTGSYKSSTASIVVTTAVTLVSSVATLVVLLVYAHQFPGPASA